MHSTTHLPAPASPKTGHRRMVILHRVQVACQGKSGRPPAAGFTLVEMLAVIVIIGVLASSLAYAVTKARALARQADCKSSMRQLGAAILIYRSDPGNGGRNPAWLSRLYPDYVDDKHLLVCRSDANFGVGRTRPAGITGEDTAAVQKFPETIDNRSNPGRLSLSLTSVPANTNVDACSYFYEFSAAYCDSSWACVDIDGDSKKSWWEYKEYQLLHGDAASSGQLYSASRMPMIRCYHHYQEGRIRGHPQDNATKGVRPEIQPFPITINVAYAGNVYVGPLWWEGALKPGEQ
jgi:prepilin-type N-terminal cleavage/methylation domain-containing protein